MTHYRTPCIVLVASLVASSAQAIAQKTPQEQLRTLRVPDGFEVSLFACEPMITNPSAIDIDTHGRVWVAEIQWYRARAKQPPADKIKVLEDTNGDGVADKATVFAEGVFAPMSICVAGDKVYVATSPDLWVYEDKNRDLKADGPPKKLLTGFGGNNHDHGAHSLVLGPDHKWWMAHGDTGFKVDGTDGSHIEYRWGAMLRGELDGSKLETVAVNFRNPYELCVSSFGECFFSDNDNDGNESVRAGWIMEGGNYGWYGGPPGPKGHVPAEVPFSQHWHFRGHIPGNVPATLVTGFGSPCGICFYEGEAFGPKYKNAPLHCDAGPREVRIYRHELAGYGMKATSQNIMMTEGDSYFRPDDICAAPDGSLYVADWYDGGVGGHAYNDPDRGRIFRLTPKGKELRRLGTPGPYSNIANAIAGLKSPNLATQYLAREFLLSQGQQSIGPLQRLLSDDTDANVRARALWLLDRIGPPGHHLVTDQLKNADPAFRALAVRILRRRADEHAKEILGMASDPAVEVKREVLLALPAISRNNADAALGTLVPLASTYDGTDRYQLEAIHIAAGQLKAELYAKLEQAGHWSVAKFPLMALLDPQSAGKFLVAKLADPGTNEAEAKQLLDTAVTMPSSDAARAVLRITNDRKTPAPLRRLGLQKLDTGLATAWKSFANDPQLADSLKPLLADSDLQARAIELAAKHAIKTVGPDILQLAKNRELPVPVRQRAVAAIGQLKPAGHAEALSMLLADENAEVRTAALHTLADTQDVKTLRLVLSGNRYSDAIQTQTIDRLMSGTGGALVLLRMLDANALSPSLSKQVIARAVNHPDSSVRALYEKFIPAGERPKRLGEAIKPDELLAMSGDAKHGEKVFFESAAAQCKNCHTVHGNGEAIGPDLSQIGKKYERATLLETILDPSKAIAPEYYTYLLETERGQVYAGFLLEKTDKQVVLKDSKGTLIRVPTNEVVELVKSDKSVMPDLVLRDVTAQDAADLLAFLTTLNQGSQNVTSFRVLGPFDNQQRDVDLPAAPEQSIANPDLNVEFATFGNKKVRWEPVLAENAAGFPAVDSVKYDAASGFRTSAVSHYFLVYAESTSDQAVTLLVGSDDGCKVWLNGEQIHRNATTRALGYAQDRVAATFKTGRNVILIKVVNGDGPGGVSLGITADRPVQLRTD